MPYCARSSRARGLAELERGRLAMWLDLRVTPAYEDVRALRYVACHWALGVLGGVVMLTAAIGLGYGTFGLYGWLLLDGIRNPGSFVLGSLGGFFLVFLAVQGIFGVVGLEGQLARSFPRPPPPAGAGAADRRAVRQPRRRRRPR
ncbi:hypothetical protein LV779_29525 [Streptomyces thinghirensis]|nr:hypothetical protein [Streptomyces thinghirensis]